MSYNDYELSRASQLSYFSFNRDAYIEVKTNIQGNRPYTICEYYQHSQNIQREINSIISEALNRILSDVAIRADEISGLREEILHNTTIASTTKQKAIAVLNLVDNIYNGSIGTWKVVSVVDNNRFNEPGKVITPGEDSPSTDFSSHGDGLFGVVFETEPGKAIVAFRGSEFNDLNDKILDWVVSDAGLAIEDRDTPQQGSAGRYMQNYVLGMGYNELALTGHSLGGNIAMHAAVSAFETSYSAASNSIYQVVGYYITPIPKLPPAYFRKNHLSTSSASRARIARRGAA